MYAHNNVVESKFKTREAAKRQGKTSKNANNQQIH